MKKTQRIYLDTSVISHLDAIDAPEKMADTLRLWQLIKDEKFDVVLSDVVFTELSQCIEPKQSYLLGLLQQIRYEIVEPANNMVNLASKFVDFGVLKEKNLTDCRHIAAALLSGCDIIVSWNFKHIVNAKTIKGTKVISTIEGFKDIIICSPTMLIEGDFENE